MSFTQPPAPGRVSRQYFLEVLHEVQRRGWPTRTMLAERLPGETRPNDSPAQLHPCNRLMVNLEGNVAREIMSGGRRETLVMEPGDCLFLPRMSWSIPHWDTPHLAIAVVFPHGFVRFSMSNYSWQAGPRLLVQPSPWAWNTKRAMGPPGADLLKALEAVALVSAGDKGLVQHIVLALLTCSIRHLEADSDSPRVQRPAQVWWEAVSYLQNNYGDPGLTREIVAEAVGVHPNYLSAVAAKESDGFHRTLEAIRMERAKHLLEQGCWSIKEIAVRCGYASATHFSHAYRHVSGISPKKAAEAKQSTGA